MDYYAITTKLVGPVLPVGETQEDSRRYENLEALTELVDMLILDIKRVAICRDRVEYSMSRAGKYADEFLSQLNIKR